MWGYQCRYTGWSALPEILTLACRNRGLNDIPMLVDLHGLHVHEAIARLEKIIKDWQTAPEIMRSGVLQRCSCIAVWLMHVTKHVHRIGHMPTWCIPLRHCLLVGSTCPDRLPDPSSPWYDLCVNKFLPYALLRVSSLDV